MFIKKEKDGIVLYESTLLKSAGFEHGFFTRFGGVSCGDFSSLNVSDARKDQNGKVDSRENVYENYKRALSVLGVTPQRTVGTKQVHENVVLVAEDTFCGRGILPHFQNMPDCDGVFLEGDNCDVDAVCVKTADCVPILFADKETGSVCAVHAGWRGTVKDIALVGAKMFSGKKGNIICAIGPCINECCYQVNMDVYNAVKENFDSKSMGHIVDEMFRVEDDKIYANLSEINKQLLVAFGLKSENIDVSNICTACTKDENGNLEFFSHRAMNGFSGTFVSAIKRKL